MKVQKLSFSVLLVLFLVALTAIPLVGISLAEFTVTTPAVSVDDDPMVAGATNTISATGFAATESVLLSVDGVEVAQGTTNGSGIFSSTFTVPKLVDYNATAVLRAQNTDGSTVATGSAAINPGLSVTPPTGASGAAIQVQGYAFAATQGYTITFTDVPDLDATDCISTGAAVEEVLGTGTTSRVGSLLLDTTVPVITAGTYYIVGVDASAGVCAQY